MGKLLILVGVVVIIVVVVIVLLKKNAEVAQSSSNLPAVPPEASVGGAASSSAMKKLNWLEGTAGGVKGKTYHVGQRAVTLGRAPTNFVQIVDTSVSRFHIRLTPVGQGLELQDMNSSSGTKVNGKKVTKATLRDGDTFRVGEAEFVFRWEADFAVNEALVGRKAVDGNSIKPTMMEEDGSTVDQLVLHALDQYHNDPIKVAQVTHLSVDVVEKIRDKYKR